MIKYIIISFVLSIFLTGCSMQNGNDNDTNFNTEPLSASINIADNNINFNNTENQNKNDATDNNPKEENQNSNNTADTSKPASPVETTIAEASTKIYDKTPARLNNLRIACNKLSGTTVNASSGFSFCQTVGPSSEKDGYLKADGLDSEGNKIKVLGGGKCQISSTLYNAVLKVPELNVTERHTHSKAVPYVAKGKDATVAYDYLDLKFINNLASPIKIYASTNDKYVSIRLVKLT